MRFSTILVTVALGSPVFASAAERPVDPTFLYRRLPDVAFQEADVTTPTRRYRPLFGEGDSQTSIVKGVARYGEIVVDAGGECAETNYPAEEQIYFVLQGSGKVSYRGKTVPVREEDFMYFAPAVAHAAVNTSGEPLHIIVMGFHIPKGLEAPIPDKLPLANTRDAKKQVVGNHPPTTLYQLLMGDTTSKRDVLASARMMTSLFIMEFAPGGGGGGGQSSSPPRARRRDLLGTRRQGRDCRRRGQQRCRGPASGSTRGRLFLPLERNGWFLRGCQAHAQESTRFGGAVLVSGDEEQVAGRFGRVACPDRARISHRLTVEARDRPARWSNRPKPRSRGFAFLGRSFYGRYPAPLQVVKPVSTGFPHGNPTHRRFYKTARRTAFLRNRTSPRQQSRSSERNIPRVFNTSCPHK